VWKDKEEIKKFRTIDKIFLSKIDQEKRNQLYHGWQVAVAATRAFKI